MRHSLKKHLITLSFVLITANSFAVDEDYYSADIDNAIQSAKENPVNESYVGARWYNRSTSRSFDFPKMMNTEMDKEAIEGAVEVRKTDKEAVANAQLPINEIEFDKENRANTMTDAISDNRRNIRAGVNVTNKIDVPYEIYIKEVSAEGIMGSSIVREVRGRPHESYGCVHATGSTCNPRDFKPNDTKENRIY